MSTQFNQINSKNPKTRSLVFIDSGVDDYQSLAAGVSEGVEAIVLDRDKDGIEQITTEMEKFASIHGGIDAVHIFSHGSPGSLQLGNTVLATDTLQKYHSQLQQWQTALTNKADILLYGCNVAAGEGAAFIEQLGELTGADIAASVDLTGGRGAIGGRPYNGDWDLEFTIGEIETPLALRPEAIAAYNGVLATITVTNNNDSGAGSLRAAIASAAPGDTIQFAPSLAGQTITLTSGQLDINKNLIIDGAGAPGIKISGNNASRVFEIKLDSSFNPTNVTLRNLIIADGQLSGTDEAAAGAGIKTTSNTTLTVENCQINNNVAAFGGGGIFTGFRATTTVINCKFDGNDGRAGGQERGGGAIATKSLGTLTVKDSQFTNNKGMNGGAINNLLGKLTVENSTFINNDTVSGGTVPNGSFYHGAGGAIYTDGASDLNDPDSGTILIRNSRFESNKAAGQGGAMFLFAYPPDKVIVEGCTIVNNQVLKNTAGEALGGGLRAGNAEFTIGNTTFANNVALTQGGGLWVGEKSPVTITNSTFSGNRAQDVNGTSGLGGAITINNFNTFATNIVNTTIANNFAGNSAGAIYSGNQPITLKNTIVANNTAGNPFGINQQTNRQLIDGGNNLEFPGPQTTDPQDVKITANVAIADPKLGPLQDNGGGILTHALLLGSAAIDAGSNAGSPATDERGFPRPQDGDSNGTALVDIGAYELPAALPEIEVVDNTTNIPDGTTTALNFGTTTVGTPITKTLTVKNSGTGVLNLSNLQLPTGFTPVGTLPATVPAAGQATFQVQLDASAAGNPNGELSFATNDSDENPFNFAISGNVNAPATPEIELVDNTTNIADDTTVAIDFGTTTVGTPIIKTLTVKNTGNADLNLSNLLLPTGFTLLGNLPATVAPSNQATFQVQLDASAASNPNGQLSISTNDSDENPFNFAIAGTVNAPNTSPEIDVLDNTTNIADGTTIALEFGTTTVGTAITKTFTINNTGNADLNLSNLQLPTGFTPVGTLPATVPASSMATFQVQLDANTQGNPNGELSFATNDSDENPFNFAIRGTVNANICQCDELCNGDTVIPNPNPVANTLLAPSNNPFFGTPASEAINGTPGNNFLLGLGGNDNLYGFEGNDTLHGNTENDYIDGGDGDDILHGGKNSDALLGSGGNDFLFGDNDNDNLFGGDGNDTLHGNKGDDTLDGGIGADTLHGGQQNDLLYGKGDNDVMFGDNDSDTLCGGDGNDFLNGNKADDFVEGGEGNDTLHGGMQNDKLCGDTGDDVMFGDNDNDSLCGGDGNDFLNGNKADDFVEGGEGADTLRGGMQNDILTGGNGDDFLWGDLGNDTLTGGSGSDVFVFRPGDASDLITDFQVGVDLLGLAGGLTFAQLTVTSGSNASIISVSSNGELLATLNGVPANAIGAQNFTQVMGF